MTFDAGDVIIVPFPFTDRTTTKRRPALVLSNAATVHAVSEAGGAQGGAFGGRGCGGGAGWSLAYL